MKAKLLLFAFDRFRQCAVSQQQSRGAGVDGLSLSAASATIVIDNGADALTVGDGSIDRARQIDEERFVGFLRLIAAYHNRDGGGGLARREKEGAGRGDIIA